MAAETMEEHKDDEQDKRMSIIAMHCTLDVRGNEVFRADNDQARTMRRRRNSNSLRNFSPGAAWQGPVRE